MMKRFLLTTLAVLVAATAADAGPLRALFGRGRCHGGGCQPAAQQPEPQWVPATAAAPVVVRTSYDGLGVPVSPVQYQPIQVGQPLPTGVRQFSPQVFSPPLWGGFCPTCPNGGCGR